MMPQDLERFNGWWSTGKVRNNLALPYHRTSFSKVEESFPERQILIITGLRRIGKTTLLYQAIEKLLETTPPRNIIYFSFEESTAHPKEVLELYEKTVLKKPLEDAGRTFVLFDEVQNIQGWPTIIKQFYDLYPNLKFLISGSSSLLLSTEATDKLAGRFFLLQLKPLGFLEFLKLKGIQASQEELFSRRMTIYFQEYLKKSGFPEIVNWQNEDRIAEYVKNSVIDRIALHDIPLIFKTRDLALMENLVKLILQNPGCIINLNTLSKTWGASKITLANYLKFLEASLLIRSLANYKPSFMASSRKLKKYYPATPSLIFAYKGEGSPTEQGRILETYAVNALDAQYYFREGKKEIDIVQKNGDAVLPVEIKQTVEEQDIARFAKAIKIVGAQKGVMISADQTMEHQNIKVIPAYTTEMIQPTRLQ